MKRLILLALLLMSASLSLAFASDSSRPTAEVSNSGSGECRIIRGHYAWNCWHENGGTLTFAAYRAVTCAMNGSRFHQCTEHEYRTLQANTVLRVPAPCLDAKAVQAPPRDTAQDAAIATELKFLRQEKTRLFAEGENLRVRVVSAEKTVALLKAIQEPLRRQASMHAAETSTPASTSIAPWIGEALVAIIVALLIGTNVWTWAKLRSANKREENIAVHNDALAKENGRREQTIRTLLEGSKKIWDYASRCGVKPDDLLSVLCTSRSQWPYELPSGKVVQLPIEHWSERGPVFFFDPGDSGAEPELLSLKKLGAHLKQNALVREVYGVTLEDLESPR